MKWLLGAFLGMIIAFCIYGMIGALCNFLIGPILGYNILQCSLWGLVITKENGKYKFDLGEFCLI